MEELLALLGSIQKSWATTTVTQMRTIIGAEPRLVRGGATTSAPANPREPL
jgi:hypothetical protein